MPLVLTLSKGDGFEAGDFKFVVKEILSEDKFLLLDVVSGVQKLITDSKSAEVAQDVFVSTGDRGSHTAVHCVIDAPRSILITRTLRASKRHKEKPNELP